MKTVLEIFYLRILGERVRYQRNEVNLSRKGSDPDNLIWSRIRQEPRHSATEEHEFVVHSTSWRYERPGKVILTYVAYSDELTFEKGKAKSLPLKNLRTAGKNLRKPAELQKKVVSHLRTILLVIQRQKRIVVKMRAKHRRPTPCGVYWRSAFSGPNFVMSPMKGMTNPCRT